MAHAGVGLIVAGLVLSAWSQSIPSPASGSTTRRNLVSSRGLWRTYLGDLTRWGFLLIGLGVLITSGASSLLERIDPFEQLSSGARTSRPPKNAFAPFSLGASLFLCGCLIFSYPALMLDSVAAVPEFASRTPAVVNCSDFSWTRSQRRRQSRHSARIAAASSCGDRDRITRADARRGLASLAQPGRGSAPCRLHQSWRVTGFPELCDRRLDEVVFAGAHNAMSNQDAPGWMFPHHEAGMPQMLQDGIRGPAGGCSLRFRRRRSHQDRYAYGAERGHDQTSHWRGRLRGRHADPGPPRRRR